MKLIVNADDLGLTAGVNQAVLLGVSRGIVTSASLMVNQDATRAAVQYLRSGLIPGAGVHLCLTAGRPVAERTEVPSLIDEAGYFYPPRLFVQRCPPAEEIEREFRAQIETARAWGVHLTHLDTHHHIHRLEAVLEALTSVARRYGLPLRHVGPDMRDALRRRGVPTPDCFCGEWIGSAVSLESLQRAVLAARDAGCGVMELMTHPGFADTALAARSSYVAGRQRELAALCTPGLREWLAANGVTLADYSCLEKKADEVGG